MGEFYLAPVIVLSALICMADLTLKAPRIIAYPVNSYY
jgi:hypothetical protein